MKLGTLIVCPIIKQKCYFTEKYFINDYKLARTYFRLPL